MKILVTGEAGFIGLAVIRQYINDTVEKIFENHHPYIVMYLAAESHFYRSIDRPAKFVQTNIVGTCNLLGVARQYWGLLPEDRKNVFRFHHVSAYEVYGDLIETGFFTEETSNV